MSVAKSYAQALFDGAKEVKTLPTEVDHFENQLESFLEIIENSRALKIILWGPTSSVKEKVAVIKELLRKYFQNSSFPKILENFILLLARKGRLPLLAEIRKAFSLVRLENLGGITGTLVSADPLDEGDQKNLAQAFSLKLEKKVVFQTHIDPTLLAGVKVTINGVTYDGTLRAQLQRLRDQLVFGSKTVH